MSENEKSCLECGSLIKGRVDKRFCDDMCRSAFNNKIKKERHQSVKSINQILMHNREVLASLINKETGKATVSNNVLLQNNFNFKYHTSIYKTQKGQEYIFVYEYGYLKIENDRYFLVKNDRELA
jgi:hypothetical protein